MLNPSRYFSHRSKFPRPGRNNLTFVHLFTLEADNIPMIYISYLSPKEILPPVPTVSRHSQLMDERTSDISHDYVA